MRRKAVSVSRWVAIWSSAVSLAALGGCTTENQPDASPPGNTSVSSEAADPPSTPKERRTKSLVGTASERLAVGESAELFIGVHCGLRYATIDGSGWEVVKADRGFNSGGGMPLIEGVATRVSSDVVVFRSSRLRDEITLRPGERPKDFVCF